MGRLSLRLGKVARSWVEDLDVNGDNIMNLIRPYHGKVSEGCWDRYYQLSKHSRVIFKKLPKPNCTLMGYESNPGVWVVEDSESPLVFLVYSDCHRKNAFKGTSVTVADKNNQEFHQSCPPEEFEKLIHELISFLFETAGIAQGELNEQNTI